MWSSRDDQSALDGDDPAPVGISVARTWPFRSWAAGPVIPFRTFDRAATKPMMRRLVEGQTGES